MKGELSQTEQRYIHVVLEELTQYKVSKKDRDDVEQQLREHFQEAYEHGDEGLQTLGDAPSFVRDYLETNGVDFHNEIRNLRGKSTKKTPLLFIGVGIFIVTYLVSQWVLTLTLTTSFSPINDIPTFQYNIIYRIAENIWWNTILVLISLSIALFLSTIVTFLLKKRNAVGANR
ncbi:hypothetical protein GCM10008967_39210 [Bacillus carboniphilus]|uniref:DUF1700 domain-containing protein n=1 Tax=Bacillus carboniphilus TaxID=86663 RepID=A0ABP3GGD7_9BACI